MKYCTIGAYYWIDSVFEKHILLHTSSSWLIRVRFLHPWAETEPESLGVPSLKTQPRRP